MPQFTPKPPCYEARPFNGGDDSALEIQGWLETQNVSSQRIIHDAEEGEETTETIKFQGNDLNSGEWLMLKDGEFQVIGASDLYTQYSQQ